jgi:hypothetical protein
VYSSFDVRPILIVMQAGQTMTEQRGGSISTRKFRATVGNSLF